MSGHIGALGGAELGRLLRGRGLALRIGPFTVNLRSRMESVRRSIELFYADYESVSPDEFLDFRVRVDFPAGLRRWMRPQAVFSFDGIQPFLPLPANQGFALFEWGLNWCIASNAHQFAVIHSAVVARDDVAVILPGVPGSGKSTLCAALVTRGWRLLSDEMALVDLSNGDIVPVPRPVSLKNQSVGLIKAFAPDAAFGPLICDTSKGDLSHMRVPDASLAAAGRRARARWVVFPRYRAGAGPELSAISQGQATLQLIENCFNFAVLGAQAFESLCGLVSACEGYRFEYSRLEDAIDVFDQLAAHG